MIYVKLVNLLFVELVIGDEITVCGLIYHRPGTNKNVFINEIESLLNNLNDENKKVHLFGDFNFDLLKLNDNAYVKQLVNLFHSNNFFNIINKPTRVTATSATVIDHLWSNNVVNCVNKGIFYEFISDHFPIFGSFKCGTDSGFNQPSYVYRESRDFSLGNKVNLKNALDSIVWDLVYASNNANIAYDNFILIFSSLF